MSRESAACHSKSRHAGSSAAVPPLGTSVRPGPSADLDRYRVSRQTTSWPRHSLERSGVVGPWWWPAATGQEEDIALLFTDVVLPGGTNGRALPEEVVRRRPSSRVLFTTGYTKNAIVHHGR